MDLLLVEDNEINQEVAGAMLRKRGHLVTIVSDGAQAVEAVRRKPFDLVLMDIQMPVMDGFAATAAIRRLPGGASLPIIALTADALPGEREHCIAKGMNGYLTKPFKSFDLFSIVEGWSNGPRANATPAGETPAQAPAIDLKGFRETMRRAGAEEAVDGIIDAFLLRLPVEGAALAVAMTGGNVAEVAAISHRLKSSAGTLGAKRLAAQLSTLEQKAKLGSLAETSEATKAVEAEIDAVLGQLRAGSAGAAPPE